MAKGTANLRISYVGGGFDYPQYFKQAPMPILTEGIPYSVECVVGANTVTWLIPFSDVRGLGSSGAKWLSFMRATSHNNSDHDSIINAIHLECHITGGGWQDVIAASRQGLMRIELHGNLYRRLQLIKPDGFDKHRHLYRIPVERFDAHILKEQERRDLHMRELANAVVDAERALKRCDYEAFGKAVLAGWTLKKTWHAAIANQTIRLMERRIEALGAYGWKVCGAGGQGAMLVIATPDVHAEIKQQWSQLL